MRDGVYKIHVNIPVGKNMAAVQDFHQDEDECIIQTRYGIYFAEIMPVALKRVEIKPKECMWCAGKKQPAKIVDCDGITIKPLESKFCFNCGRRLRK